MEVKVCKNCRRLFNYIYGPELCPECVKLSSGDMADQSVKGLNATLKPMIGEDEEKFEQVKEYIIAHPKATVIQIAEENDITPSRLFEWIRDDRLEFSDDSQNAWFECTKCGTKIQSGRLCNRCKANK